MSKRANIKKSDFLKQIAENNEFINNQKDYLNFNFKYYAYGENEGESFEEWEKEQILADLNNKLKIFSEKKKKELISDGTLEIFRNYPLDSNFSCPVALSGRSISWARLRITGKRRLIGFFINDIDNDADSKTDVFFVVFLDKNHLFAPSIKKHT